MFRKALACVAIVHAVHHPQIIKRNLVKRSLSTSINTKMAALSEVRKLLKEQGIDAFIVGSGDAHQSEYVSDYDMRRQFISNFTGSAGTALILQESALLWTDGRYFLQAANELSSDWTLMKSGEPKVPEISEWITKNLSKGQTVGIDASLVPASSAKTLKKTFEDKCINFVSVASNPVDTVWNQHNRPAAPANPIVIHGIERSGVDHNVKISQVQDFIKENNASALVVSMLDEIAWLFNIRGSDVAYNPVVISYAVVALDKAYLFVDEVKVSADVLQHLGENVIIRPYSEIEAFLTSFVASGDKKVLIDSSQLNWQLTKIIGDNNAIAVTSPITLNKSLKNEVELNGIRAAHIRDGVALTAFIHWLENTVKAAPNSITECDAMTKLEEFRGKIKYHQGPSFATIAGYGPKGAIIHYHSEPATTSKIGVDSLFLLDSGAQYLDGTTDVTRTMHFGTPTQHMKDCYTAVLKGHIAMAKMVFPVGTCGTRFDCVARQSLWELGLDYNHGTGHGVGAFLNVHEGPQMVGPRARVGEKGFVAGMTISNEPGYYEDGNFGIRIENICIAVNKETPHNFNNKGYLCFETVTMVPMKTDLINVAMLSDAEINWINEYHVRVRDVLMPGMKEQFPEAVEYLVDQTKPIVRN